MKSWNPKSYILVLGATIMLLLAACIGINIFTDPLFFFGGNKISAHGYYMNERISVMAHNRHRWETVNCLIFGSSRMTFLDARKIKGNNCANIAYSAGLPEEFLVYAKYLKAHGTKVQLIIIGLDNFESAMTHDRIPDFILASKPLPVWPYYYMSGDTLLFSLKALTHSTKSPNYYDSNYRKHVGFPLRRAKLRNVRDQFYDMPINHTAIVKRAAIYRQICHTFANAKCVGLTPPISTWALENVMKGKLQAYLGGIKTLSQEFDTYYDFSILPSHEWNYTDSYDGIHFTARVYDILAAKISDPSTVSWGLDVKKMSITEYEKRYRQLAATAVRFNLITTPP